MLSLLLIEKAANGLDHCPAAVGTGQLSALKARLLGVEKALRLLALVFLDRGADQVRPRTHIED